MFHDHFSAHAPDYRTHRPTYPPELFAFLASVSPGRELAWDCGTRNGQAAVSLADHFARVFATDPSAEQIRQAEPKANVRYAVAPAEACPLPDASADLITVAQALHWFDFDRFYAEVRRVLKPGGVIAAWGYAFHRVSADVDTVLDHYEGEFVGPYWPPERKLLEAGYATVPFPFAEVPAPVFELRVNWTLAEMLGYMNTWSANKRFAVANGFNPVERKAGEFAAAWGDPTERRPVTWDLFLKVGRVS